MRRILPFVGIFLGVFAVILGFWYALFVLANHMGFDTQSTPQYGFTSGVGPMLLTAIGMSTLITGMWHSLNCHEPGCYRIGRHRINGSPWCNVHHKRVENTATTDDLLRQIIVLLERMQTNGET